MARMYAGRKAETTTCKQCDKRFKFKRADTKFCSPSCRVKYNRDLQARRLSVTENDAGSVTEAPVGEYTAIRNNEPNQTDRSEENQALTNHQNTAQKHPSKLDRYGRNPRIVYDISDRTINCVGDPLVGNIAEPKRMARYPANSRPNLVPSKLGPVDIGPC